MSMFRFKSFVCLSYTGTTVQGCHDRGSISPRKKAISGISIQTAGIVYPQGRWVFQYKLTTLHHTEQFIYRHTLIYTSAKILLRYFFLDNHVNGRKFETAQTHLAFENNKTHIHL